MGTRRTSPRRPPRGRRQTGRTAANRWEDHYSRQARKQGYPARSVFKLEEIQKKFRVLRPGDRVLDLGCAPGSWLLYAAAAVGPKGTVVGVDLKPVTVALPGHARALVADAFDPPPEVVRTLQGPFDVVLSDMAPATTGHPATDAARSYMLCQRALQVAVSGLRPGGILVCKIFQGPDAGSFADALRQVFDRVAGYKPQSSRKASREIFYIGLGKTKQEETIHGRS